MSNLNQHQLSSTTINTENLSLEASQSLARTVAEAADDKKAGEIVLLQVAEVSYLTDYFVIVTGFSRAQVRAIAESIEEKVELDCQRQPLRVEGKTDAGWILIDYGDVIVHIFLPTEREYYNLEAFWGHAQRIEFQSAKDSVGI